MHVCPPLTEKKNLLASSVQHNMNHNSNDLQNMKKVFELHPFLMRSSSARFLEFTTSRETVWLENTPIYFAFCTTICCCLTDSQIFLQLFLTLFYLLNKTLGKCFFFIRIFIWLPALFALVETHLKGKSLDSLKFFFIYCEHFQETLYLT